MKCSKFTDRFMELDDYSAIPLVLKIHMCFCHRCSMEARLIMEEMYRLGQMSIYESPRDITQNVMMNIEGRSRHFSRRVSNSGWLFGGTLIFSSIVLVTFSNSFSWAKDSFGAEYAVPMNIVMGVVLSIYAAVFAGSCYKSMESTLHSLSRWMKG